MYKTLFRMAYPFSYDLDDLGRYWLGHERLMAHWRRVLPADRFLELDYEALVTAQGAQSRRLVAHAGLAWDEACLARSEEHTSELQSLMRISYAVFCLKKQKYTH